VMQLVLVDGCKHHGKYVIFSLKNE